MIYSELEANTVGSASLLNLFPLKRNKGSNPFLGTMFIFPTDFNPHSRIGSPNKKRFISVSGKWPAEALSSCRVYHREKREQSISRSLAIDEYSVRYLRERYSSQLGDRDG